MLLIVEEGIRSGICQAIYRYAKGNNKYMDNYDQKNNIKFLHLDANNLYRWEMSEKLHINGFKWVEDWSEFNECFIKNLWSN